MQASVLVSGVVTRAPERRKAKTGAEFVSLSLREDGADRYWSVSGFNDDVCDELMRLGVGDSLAVTGPLRVEEYEGKDGARRLSFQVVARRVLSAHPPPRKKPQRRVSRAPPTAPDPEPAAADTRPWDDTIPF
jgi:single-stranded DNA-binding protein